MTKTTTATLLTAAFVALGVLTGSAQAATIFSEDFDNESTSTQLNYDSFSQFTVTSGTVDYNTGGTYGITCAGGSGGCVDLDGSTYEGGTMVSDAFAIVAGTTYTISFDIAGNMRGWAPDTVNFGITDGQFSSSIVGITSDTAFYTYTAQFVASISGLVSFFISNEGGDKRGAILDNVVISSVDTPIVPTPASLPLLIGALGSASLLRRRKKS